jgi:hypothetical protein
MSESSFTMLEDGKAASVAASLDGSVVRFDTAPVLSVLGWTQKPEGLCQGDVCIPISNRPELITDQGIDLVALGDVLGRPVAMDAAQSVVSIGAPTEAHGDELLGGRAPDFVLPDLRGKEYSLSSFRGKKVLLIAYASW